MITLVSVLFAQTLNPVTPEFWQDHSLIYAQVSNVTRLSAASPLGPGEFTLTLQPKATIGGKFDSCFEPTIDVWLAPGAYPFLEPVPREKAMIVALIWTRNGLPNRPPLTPKYQLELAPMPLFPERESLPPPGFPNAKGVKIPVVGYVEVEQFESPQIDLIREAVVKLRARDRPNP